LNNKDNLRKFYRLPEVIYSGKPVFEYDYLHEFEHKFKKGNSYLVIGKSLDIFELTPTAESCEAGGVTKPFRTTQLI
jgi:hypothetical protein